METTTPSLIETWGQFFTMGSYLCYSITIFIIVVHELRIMLNANPRDRYNYVNLHEIRFFWYALIAFTAGISIHLTVLIIPYVPVDNFIKIFVAIFFVATLATVIYLALSNLLRILYPRFLENRLTRIRNKPRTSSAGNKMRKLSAGEGSEHLELSEQQEHSSEVHSIQYDVWLDDKTGEKKVEKYMAHEHAERCDECGYYTMMVNREEIVKQPNLQESGLLVKHYRCSYCKHREARQVMLAALSTNVTPSS